jgi:hypothetical protein
VNDGCERRAGHGGPTLRGLLRNLLLAACALPASVPQGSRAAGPALDPGLYRVEVRISLPNVPNVAPPLFLDRCITAEDLASGGAFLILSDNPLKSCEPRDYEPSEKRITYRIECAGPNRGRATGVFDIQPRSYRGTITMNMGGKNMTMSETQAATRTGDCP